LYKRLYYVQNMPLYHACFLPGKCCTKTYTAIIRARAFFCVAFYCILEMIRNAKDTRAAFEVAIKLALDMLEGCVLPESRKDS
jgi:hypothetical protein